MAGLFPLSETSPMKQIRLLGLLLLLLLTKFNILETTVTNEQNIYLFFFSQII